MADGGAPPPITSAVVIGIGGSGVNTLGRIRRAVRDKSRPDRVAIDNVKFLAIDAVEQTAQLPPLPAGASLETSEFVNIASNPINAHEYVRQAWHYDEMLRDSWDTTYTPPNQPLTDGMKRSRSLGNLVFRVQASAIQTSIQRTLDAAVELNPELYGAGAAGARNRIQVFIVTSCAGGTGSSGFLHVLHAVHRAARAGGISVAVYPVIFLPDIFLGPRARGLKPQMETRAHHSNAFAFFSEFDYVIAEPGAFDRLLTPKDQSPTDLAPLDIIETAFLIDGRLTDGSIMNQTDAYDLAASGLYSLLMTEVSSTIGIAGTNVDVKGFDALTPPQRTAYGTMGSFRTVFPASTFRRYARARLRSHLIQQCLLDDGVSTDVVSRAAPVIKALTEGISGLSSDFEQRANGLDSVRTLRMKAANVDTLRTNKAGVAEAAQTLLQQITAAGTNAGEELGSVLPQQARSASGRIAGVIDDTLMVSGEGVTVLRYAVEKARLKLQASYQVAQGTNQDARTRMIALEQHGAADGLHDCCHKVGQASERNFFVKQGELKEAINNYLDAANGFAHSVVRSHISEADMDLLQAADRELAVVELSLKTAATQFADLRSDSDRTWQDDEFEGKDAGAHSLTALVPSDVLPEVEDSLLAGAIWQRLLRNIERNPGLQPNPAVNENTSGGRQWVRNLYQAWWQEGRSRQVRGLVAFGQGDTDAVSQTRAAEDLERILRKEIDDLAQLDPRQAECVIPRDIWEAAALADAAKSGKIYDDIDEGERESGEQYQRSQNALNETLRRAGNVALQIDSARVALQGGQSLPAPLKTAAATGRVKEQIEKMRAVDRTIDSGDPEQVTTLTLQMGFPIGAVRGLDLWHEAFRRVTRDRATYLAQSQDPPPFLDAQIAATVTSRPLVRRLYSENLIADYVVQGTAVLRMMRHHPELSRRLGLESPLDSRWQPGRTGVAEMVCRSYIVRDGRVLPNGNQVAVLGSTAVEIFDHLASEAAMQQSIESVFDWLLGRARDESRMQQPLLLEALTKQVADYKSENADIASALPRENPTPEVLREGEVRRAIDSACMRTLDEIQGDVAPELAPILI